MKPVLIGLTGGIGSGKSTVAAMLAELGAAVVSGDELGRRALQESPSLLAQIRQHFGPAVFEADGSLNRQALAERAFATREDAAWLTTLTFPAIHALWKNVVAHASNDVLAFDAALIFEWGIENEFDLVIVVTAGRKTTLERITREGRFPRADAEARSEMQLRLEEKMRRADIVLGNDESLAELKGRVLDLWKSRIQSELERRKAKEND